MIVVDASIALAWSHPDEQTDSVLRVFQQVATQGAVAPSIWPLEMANGLQMAVRRKRITRPFRDELLANLRRLPIEVEVAPRDRVWLEIVHTADRHDLTIYDAATSTLPSGAGCPSPRSTLT